MNRWYEWLWTIGSCASILAFTLVLVDLLILSATHGKHGVRLLVKTRAKTR